MTPEEEDPGEDVAEPEEDVPAEDGCDAEEAEAEAPELAVPDEATLAPDVTALVAVDAPLVGTEEEPGAPEAEAAVDALLDRGALDACVELLLPTELERPTSPLLLLPVPTTQIPSEVRHVPPGQSASDPQVASMRQLQRARSSTASGMTSRPCVRNEMATSMRLSLAPGRRTTTQRSR